MERQAREILWTDEDEIVRCEGCSLDFAVEWPEAKEVNAECIKRLGECPRCGEQCLSVLEKFRGLEAAGSLMNALPSEIVDNFGEWAYTQWDEIYGSEGILEDRYAGGAR